MFEAYLEEACAEVVAQAQRMGRKKAVIVMDNASYHSRRLEKLPTSNSRKGDMLEWLDKHKIPYDAKLTKVSFHDFFSLQYSSTVTSLSTVSP